MKLLRPFILGLLLPCMLLTACVDELDFEQESTSEFVLISGVVSNSPGERTIKVLRGSGIKSREFEPINVRGSIFRDGQFWDQLAVQGIGELYVPFNLKLEEGRAYEIEITTQDNDVFRSSPQIVQPKAEIHSLSFSTERRFSGTNYSGLPKTDIFVDIFSHINLSDQDQPNYFRWQVDGTFSFVEVARTGTPQVDPIQTCYISHRVEENPTTVLSSEGLASGEVRKLVNSRVVDESFLFRHVVNVYLHAIDRETFEYYDRALRLINSSGNLFDEIPAPVQGNIKKTSGKSETVLGFINFSLVDTMRISLSKGDLGVSISNVCTTLNPCPVRPTPPGGNVNPIYCKCWDCNLALPNASLFPPFFWDE